MWVLLALGTALLTSLIPVIVKRLLTTTEVPVVIWAAQVVALPLLAAFAFGVFGVPTLQPGFLPIVGLVVMLNVGAHLASTTALKTAEASVVAPTLALSPVITLTIGVVLFGERPAPTGILGVLLMIGGAYLLQLETWKDAGRPFRALRNQHAPRLAVVAACLWGVTPLLEKLAISLTQPANPPLVPLCSSLGTSLLLFPLIVRSPARLAEQVRRAGPGLLVIGLISGVAPALGFSALRLGLASYVTALFTLRIAFILLWSVLLLGERPPRWRWLGVALLVLGAIAISR